jgi:hypothetical protein
MQLCRTQERSLSVVTVQTYPVVGIRRFWISCLRKTEQSFRSMGVIIEALDASEGEKLRDHVTIAY